MSKERKKINVNVNEEKGEKDMSRNVEMSLSSWFEESYPNVLVIEVLRKEKKSGEMRGVYLFIDKNNYEKIKKIFYWDITYEENEDSGKCKFKIGKYYLSRVVYLLDCNNIRIKNEYDLRRIYNSNIYKIFDVHHKFSQHDVTKDALQLVDPIVHKRIKQEGKNDSFYKKEFPLILNDFSYVHTECVKCPRSCAIRVDKKSDECDIICPLFNE